MLGRDRAPPLPTLVAITIVILVERRRLFGEDCD